MEGSCRSEEPFWTDLRVGHGGSGHENAACHHRRTTIGLTNKILGTFARNQGLAREGRLAVDSGYDLVHSLLLFLWLLRLWMSRQVGMESSKLVLDETKGDTIKARCESHDQKMGYKVIASGRRQKSLETNDCE